MMRNLPFGKSVASIKNKWSSRVFEALYRRMGKFYIEDYPELENTEFSRIYPTLLCHNIEIVRYDRAENFVYLKKDALYFFTTPDYPWIVREIFAQHIYFIHPKYLKHTQYVVFDFGMNRGYASIYFASQPWCKAVYGFELNEYTFALAEQNTMLNFGLRDKISLFNFGLGKQDEFLKCYYLPHRDGICTTSYDFLQSYAPEELDRVIEKEIAIKKTSTVIENIASGWPAAEKVILKIDVEGAEYDILEDLIKEYPAFLAQVEIIIGEAHMGLEQLIKALAPFGFEEVSIKNYNPKTTDFLFVKNGGSV
jgi:FkbM family methyltransferase